MSASGVRERCYRCGDADHIAADCTSKDRLCFNCRQPGHQSRMCPKPRGVLNRTCGGCGEKGHVADDCTVRESWMCKNCAESGHGHWECPQPKGFRRKRCHLCRNLGHTSTDCDRRGDGVTTPNGAASHGGTGNANFATKRRKRNRKQNFCTVCGGVGHRRWECFQRRCSSCGTLGSDVCYCFVRPAGQDENQENISPASEDVSSSPEDSSTAPHVDSRHEKVELSRRCHHCGSHQHRSDKCVVFHPETTVDVDEPDVQTESCSSSTDHQPCEPTPREESPQLSAEERVGRTKAQRLWLSAVDALSLEDHQDRAISLLSQAIDLHPTEAQYYLTRATAYVKTRQFTEALQDFDTASTKDGYEGDVDVFLQVARCRLLLGSPTSALLAVRDALACDPGDRDALDLRRRILDLEGHIDAYKGAVARKHWRMARSAYESCLSVYAQEDSDAPTYVRCWGIEMLVVEGCWDEAQKSVDILLREDTDAVDAMILRGLVLFLRAELSDSIEQIGAVLSLDPDNQRAKDLRHRVKDVSRLKQSGNDAFGKSSWTEAKQAWSDALQLVAEKEEEGCGGIMRATLLLNRATVHQKLATWAEGLKDINESLKLRETYFKAFLCRARLLVGLELYETAVEDFRSALERGKAVMSENDARKVEAELEEAERLAAKEHQKEKDYYAVLGLDRTCTAAEIKKAYRTMSLKHHPDKGGVAEKFKMIARAYEVLSDPEQKRSYDAKQRSTKSTRASTRDYYSYDDDYDYDDDSDSGYW